MSPDDLNQYSKVPQKSTDNVYASFGRSAAASAVTMTTSAVQYDQGMSNTMALYGSQTMDMLSGSNNTAGYRSAHQATQPLPTPDSSLVNTASDILTFSQPALSYAQLTPPSAASVAVQAGYRAPPQQSASSFMMNAASGYASQWPSSQMSTSQQLANMTYAASGRLPVTLTRTQAQPIDIYPNSLASTAAGLAANDAAFERPQYLQRLTSIPEQPSQGDTWGVRTIPRKRSKRTANQRSPYDV